VDRVRIGVVGAANIGRKVVIPAILRARNAELVALASSSDAGARFLRDTGLAAADGRPLRDAVRLHRGYAGLLADPDVDAVYIPLPNHLHAEWSARAADAGKHVLCEKPAALDAAQTAAMIDHCTSRGVVWMEAFMYRFHPQWQIVRRLLDEGAIGELRAVVAVFTFTVRDPGNVRRVPEYGGGSLSGSSVRSPEGVDEEFRGLLDFGAGGSALILSSLSQPYRHHVRLLGTEGDITVPRAWPRTSTGSRSRTSRTACFAAVPPRSSRTSTRSRTCAPSTRSMRRRRRARRSRSSPGAEVRAPLHSRGAGREG
jgi:D-xylose 1-dehydrogenase (NADP+, D-xylono-1,5-lactone-forming)